MEPGLVLAPHGIRAIRTQRASGGAKSRQRSAATLTIVSETGRSALVNAEAPGLPRTDGFDRLCASSVHSVQVPLLPLAPVGVAGSCETGPCVPCFSREGSSVKRTFQPNNRRRARKHGFRIRMRTRAGRAIVQARRKKGRARLTA